jgi:polysaccharide biosynthesis protein PslF
MDTRRVAVLTSYPPRRCGIASFSAALCASMGAAAGLAPSVIAVEEPQRSRSYGREVVHVLGQDDSHAYRRLSGLLDCAFDTLIVQHEYGLFGGSAGDYVLDLLENWRGKTVVALHTTPSNPTGHLREVTRRLCSLSSTVVVLSNYARDTLGTVYSVDDATIRWIPHGTARIEPSRTTTRSAKRRLDVRQRPLLLTAGFTGPNKGIEYALDALAKIVRQWPDVLYVIVGQSHPRDEAARAYRIQLEAQVRDLDLSSNVKFVPRFLREQQLVDWLIAADICLLPYVDPEQVSSGQLARCLGLGRAVVATAFPYARDLLGDGIGVLVPMRDAQALAEAVESLLASPERIVAAQQRAFEASVTMSWDRVARMYLQLAEHDQTPQGRSLPR